MSKTTTTISVADAVAAMERNETIINIKAKPAPKVPVPKDKQPLCKYYEAVFTVNIVNADGTITTKTCNGDFTFKGLITTKPPVDPTDASDARNAKKDNDNKNVVVQSTLSKSGDVGKFLMLLRLQFEAAVARAAKEIQGFNIGKRNIASLIKTHISDEADENAGAELTDPIVYLKVEAGKYPEKHFARGQYKCLIYDKASERVKNGRYEYDLATIPCEDEEAEPEVVVAENLFKYLNYGSVIDGRINCGSVVISQSWISIPMKLSKMVVVPGVNSSAQLFDDDIADVPDTPTDPQSKISGGDPQSKISGGDPQAKISGGDNVPTTKVSAYAAATADPVLATAAQNLLDSIDDI